jgi:antirestriction protein ArdC
MPRKWTATLSPTGYAIEQRIESAELFFSRINARCASGESAFYSPDSDSITLPPFAAFCRQRTTTARARMKPDTGHRTRADAIANWGNFGDNAYRGRADELTAAFGR